MTALPEREDRQTLMQQQTPSCAAPLRAEQPGKRGRCKSVRFALYRPLVPTDDGSPSGHRR